MVRARFRVSGAGVCLQSPQGDLVTVCGRCAGRDGGERTQQKTLADRAGASWRGRSVVRWVAQAPTVPSGWEWQGAQPCQGAAELDFPGPALWQMQGEAARRAGEPSRQTEEPPPEGLGGHDLDDCEINSGSKISSPQLRLRAGKGPKSPHLRVRIP